MKTSKIRQGLYEVKFATRTWWVNKNEEMGGKWMVALADCPMGQGGMYYGCDPMDTKAEAVDQVEFLEQDFKARLGE